MLRKRKVAVEDEVSSEAAGYLLDALEDRGIQGRLLLERLPVAIEQLRDPAGRIDWNLFTLLCERFEQLLGGPAGVAEVTASMIDSPQFRRLKALGRIFRDPLSYSRA